MSIHQESVSEFSSLVEGLYQGPNAFEGDAANAVKSMTESYLQLEANFSGAGTLATSTTAASGVLTLPTTATSDIVLTDAATTSVECGVEITAAAATAAGEMGADAGLDAVTGAIDVAAVAQAGLDPVTDIPAAILTAIDMGTKIAILVALGWSVFQAVLHWINEMNRLGHITWPPLPSFLDPGGYNSGFTNQGGLTPQNITTAEELFKEFEKTGITLDEILEIIHNNPNLSKDQLRQRILLKQLEQRKGYPGKLLTLYSEDQIRKMIRAGFTNVHMAVILKEPSAGPATTPGGRVITRHALEDSIIRHDLTLQQIDDIIDNPSRVTKQIDGADVYIQKNAGRGQTFNIVIESDQGIVTALKNLSKQALSRLGYNNGFNPAP